MNCNQIVIHIIQFNFKLEFKVDHLDWNHFFSSLSQFLSAQFSSIRKKKFNLFYIFKSKLVDFRICWSAHFLCKTLKQKKYFDNCWKKSVHSIPFFSIFYYPYWKKLQKKLLCFCFNAFKGRDICWNANNLSN